MRVFSFLALFSCRPELIKAKVSYKLMLNSDTTLFNDYSVAKATRHYHPVTLLLYLQTKNISAAHVKCLIVSCSHNENFEMKCTFE